MLAIAAAAGISHTSSYASGVTAAGRRVIATAITVPASKKRFRSRQSELRFTLRISGISLSRYQ
jgi:hypothetical protein